jgi:hypothetical protein
MRLGTSVTGTKRQLLRRSDISGVGCRTEVTGTSQSDAIDPSRTWAANFAVMQNTSLNSETW